ncbi:MAG TPA: hypothetical protein VFH69_02890 [Gemmatimonadota bacterium]|nr:hypothetical protein [Gemmatimonadota bacterium]
MAALRLLEAVANVAIGLALLWPVRGRIVATLSSIPLPYAFLSVTSLVLLIGAQASDEGEAIYPLTDFSMYTKSLTEDQHDFYEYTAELSSGREERLLIGRLFGTQGTYLRRRMNESAEAIESPESERVDSMAVGNLDAMLEALAEEYDTDHPRDSVRTIRVWKGTVSLRDPRGPSSRRLIHEYHAQ